VGNLGILDMSYEHEDINGVKAIHCKIRALPRPIVDKSKDFSRMTYGFCRLFGSKSLQVVSERLQL
jgi:hypothetical protein